MSFKRVFKIILGKTLGPIIEYLIRNFPGLIGYGLRYYYYKLRLGRIGKRVIIDTNVYFIHPEDIYIDDNTWIDKNVIIIAGKPKGRDKRKIYEKGYENSLIQMGEVRIGKNVHIAPNVVLQGHGGLFIGDSVGVASGAKIYTLSHHYKNLNKNKDDEEDKKIIYKFTPRAPLEEQALISSPVILEDNTAIGLNSVILPGTKIGKNSWIGTLSLVRGEIPNNVIASGIPAKIVKKREIGE